MTVLSIQRVPARDLMLAHDNPNEPLPASICAWRGDVLRALELFGAGQVAESDLRIDLARSAPLRHEDITRLIDASRGSRDDADRVLSSVQRRAARRVAEIWRYCDEPTR